MESKKFDNCSVFSLKMHKRKQNKSMSITKTITSQYQNSKVGDMNPLYRLHSFPVFDKSKRKRTVLTLKLEVLYISHFLLLT